MNTTFYRLLICQIVTLFANAALRFVLPLYLLRKTGSAALYGGITAAALVPMLAVWPREPYPLTPVSTWKPLAL